MVIPLRLVPNFPFATLGGNLDSCSQLGTVSFGAMHTLCTMVQCLLDGVCRCDLTLRCVGTTTVVSKECSGSFQVVVHFSDVISVHMWCSDVVCSTVQTCQFVIVLKMLFYGFSVWLFLVLRSRDASLRSPPFIVQSIA